MQLHRKVRLAACIALPLAGIVLAVTISCSDDASEPMVPAQSGMRRLAAPPLSGKQRDRLIYAKAQTRWTGEAHHAAMDVVIKSISQYRKAKHALPKKGSTEYCVIMERAGEVALGMLDEHRGLNRSATQRRDRVRSELSFDGCFHTAVSFDPPTHIWLTTFRPVQDVDAEVTGVYDQYLSSLNDAVQGSDGSVYSVQSRIDAVLSRAVADGVPDGDLLALTSFGSLAVSSATEWNSFDWNSVDTGTCTDYKDCSNATALLQGGWDNRPLAVISADALGCFSTVAGWGAFRILLTGPAWPALAGACGFRAVLASGGAIITMIGGARR